MFVHFLFDFAARWTKVTLPMNLPIYCFQFLAWHLECIHEYSSNSIFYFVYTFFEPIPKVNLSNNCSYSLKNQENQNLFEIGIYFIKLLGL